MAILAFQKPDRVIALEKSDNFGKFEFRPLEPGYGQTIGNAMRRILLSSLEGFAINWIKIDGVAHELDTIPGVLEDVMNIILNLKQVRFHQSNKEFDSARATVVITGKEEFRAKDLGEVLTGFEVLNPDLVICHLDPSATIKMEFSINKGRGWVAADENREMLTDNDPAIIAVDSIYTPIKNVKYAVENYRVEQKTDYEKLVLEVKTDGSIMPQEALKEAARILIQHFNLFSDGDIMIDKAPESENEVLTEQDLKIQQLLKKKLVDEGLSVRALNCLKSAEVDTLGDLVAFEKNALLKFRNFGRKSLNELDDLLARYNLTFGMDTSKYKLDKD